MAMRPDTGQQRQQHDHSGRGQDDMGRREGNFSRADHGGDDRHRNDQRQMQQAAAMAMVVVMPVIVMSVVVMAMMPPRAAGRTFIQREFIADADIEFAHSSSLQNAALLAAPDISSPNHQKSIILIK
jgi:hypothetical protein